MIGVILLGFIHLVVFLVNHLLNPIDSIIQQYLPNLASGLNAVASFFNMLTSVIGWCIDATGLSSETISIIVTYYIFKLTAPLLVYVIKLALKWYRKLMP